MSFQEQRTFLSIPFALQHFMLTPIFISFREQKTFLSIPFVLQYFNKAIPNDTPVNRFLHGNGKDKIKNFDEK